VAAVGHASGLLRILDVSDRSAPRVVAQLVAPGAAGFSSHSGSIAGSVLYVAVDRQGILAFDVHDPAAPVYRGCIATNPVRRVLATNDAVYASVGEGVVALPPDCAATPITDFPPDAALPLPRSFALTPQPNPFTAEARLRWSLPASGSAELGVFDVAGRRVRTFEVRGAGRGTGVVRWDGRDAAGEIVTPGVYFVRLRFGDEALTRKLVRVR